VTPAAVGKIKEILAKESLSEDHGLRVRVVGGGCHGFSYSLNFDKPGPTDQVFAIDGVRFLVDKFSAPYLMGAHIDFVDTLQGAGFKISNPNQTASCGCGKSFK